MAWTERSLPADETIVDVRSPPGSPINKSKIVDQLREIFKDMPPFIKLTSRRARKTLAKYEATKKIHIEQLRDNPTFKFVMMVAGLTNEPMQKYWKGDSVDPFSDKYGQSSNTKICKEDLEILLKRARENAFADLHQFCRNVEAIPMYRKAKEGTISDIGNLVPESWWYVSDSDDSDYIPGESDSDDDERYEKYTEKPPSNSGTSSDSSSDSSSGSSSDSSSDEEAEELKMELSECKRERAELEQQLEDREADDEGEDKGERKIRYFVKYIYNMSDEEFHDFTELFMNDMKPVMKDKNKTKPPPSIRRFILGRERNKKNPDKDEIQDPFPAHSHFRGQRDRAYTPADWYNDLTTDGIVPTDGERYTMPGPPIPMWEDEIRRPLNRRPNNHSVDRIFDPSRVEKEGYDHPDGYVTLKRSNWWQWSNSMPIVRWEGGRDHHPEFWFQRYLARWLTREANTIGSNNRHPTGPMRRSDVFEDLEPFKNKYQGLFNNLWFKETKKSKKSRKERISGGKKEGKWMRNLTGLRLTKFVKERGNWVYTESETKTKYARRPGELSPRQAEKKEKKFPELPNNGDPFDDCAEVCEVPLDFVKPLFEERFAYWKHELVLGEYEKRAMYTADQWLQKTPWAIGKIYLMPSMFAHMQEAHIAITSRYKKFSHLNVHDWFNSERQRYFFAKLVALCIRTSAVLSNKRYGLDKAYMRLNLEKKRIMYAIGKLEVPQRTRQAAAFPRATGREQDAWQNYAAARQRGDGAAASNALRDMNMRHVPSGENTLRRMF